MKTAFSLLASLSLAGTACAAVIDVPGNSDGNTAATSNLNAIVGAGNSGRLLGDFTTHWNASGGSFSVPVDTNGHVLHLDTGNGNAGHVASGAISGSGSITVTGGPYWSGGWNVPYSIGGGTANTYTGTSGLYKGTTQMNKPAGVEALRGSITLGSAGETARLVWGASNQIHDAATITMVLPPASGGATADAGSNYLSLAGFSDTIDSLTLPDGGAKTQVRTGSGGVLTVAHLSVNGAVMAAGVYTSVNATFVTGTGSVIVPGAPPGIVDVPAGYVNANVAADLGGGNAGTAFNLLGNATFGASTGGLSGNITINNAPFTLTLAGGTTQLLGVVSGPGGLSVNGGTTTLGGAAANTLAGLHTVTAGTLALGKPAGKNAIAGNISVAGGAVLRWNAADQIANAAMVTLAGTLDFAGSAETLGALQLSGSGEMRMGGGSAAVHFASSSAQTWTGSLVIRQWDGGSEGVFFGANATGLTAGQLAQISFADPAGYAPGTHPARILATGEVVPDAAPADYVTIPAGGNYDDITGALGSGNAATNYSLAGNAQIGWMTGAQSGYFQISGAAHTLTVDTGGGNLTQLNGELRGAGNLVWIGGGGSVFWQTNASFLGGPDANTLSGTHTIQKGTLAMSKPDGITAITGNIIVGGGSNQAILRWDADHQVADSASVTLLGPQPAKLKLDGHNEVMGTLILSGDGDILLGNAAARVQFSGSAAQTWAAGKQLIIREWSGAAEGGVFFGTSASGLTAGQLAQTGFMNPAGLAAGLYHAAILPTGEVVPTGTPVVPTAPPYDISPAAVAARETLCTSTGRATLTGAGTPLADGDRIVFFGDSITWLNGYITLLNDAIASGAGTQGMGITLINRGINGGGVIQVRDGSPDAAYPGNSAQASFSAVLTADQADVAVVYIGINDVWWRNTTPATYEQALRDIAATAAAKNVRLVFATPAAHFEFPDLSGSDDVKIDQFSGIVRTVASETGATLVDLRAVFVACWRNHNYEVRLNGGFVTLLESGYLTYDGVHPNDAGNAVIADQMAEGLSTAMSGNVFNQWATDKGLVGAAAAFDADPDQDGIANCFEYLLGGQPNPAMPGSNSTAFLPAASVVGNNIVFTFTRRDEAAWLNPVVEFDTDLAGAWTTATDPGNATISITPGSPADTVTVTIPGGPRMFTRLRLTQP